MLFSALPRRNRGGVTEPSMFFSMYQFGFGEMAHAKDAVDTPAMSRRGSTKSLLALDVIMRLALNVSFLVGCPT